MREMGKLISQLTYSAFLVKAICHSTTFSLPLCIYNSIAARWFICHAGVPTLLLFLLEIILFLLNYLSAVLLALIGECNNRPDSFCKAFNFSLSASLSAFFFSSSSCLQFSSWALLNIRTKLSRVETTVSEIYKTNENKIKFSK